MNKEEVIKAENELFSAQLSSDVDTLDRLLSDDLIAVAPSGQILTKEMDLNAHREKSMTIEEASSEINDIRLTGDVALSIVTMTAKGKLMGKPLVGRFRYFRVWKCVGQTWKVIGASIQMLP
jgi:hypothetical protein